MPAVECLSQSCCLMYARRAMMPQTVRHGALSVFLKASCRVLVCMPNTDRVGSAGTLALAALTNVCWVFGAAVSMQAQGRLSAAAGHAGAAIPVLCGRAQQRAGPLGMAEGWRDNPCGLEGCGGGVVDCAACGRPGTSRKRCGSAQGAFTMALGAAGRWQQQSSRQAAKHPG